MLSEIYIYGYGYDADGRYQSVAIGTYDDFTQPFTVQIPDADQLSNITTFQVVYRWKGHVYGLKTDSSVYATNFVDSLTRSVTQDGVNQSRKIRMASRFILFRIEKIWLCPILLRWI